MSMVGSEGRSPTILPLSDFLGPQRRAQLLRQARFFMVAAVLLGGIFAGGILRWFITEMMGDGLSTRQWLLDFPGSVLLVVLIWFVPYGLARSYRRRATTHMWLDGSRLVMSDPYRRREVDLVTQICHVKLAGGRGSPYYPALAAYRDQADIWPTMVDLCEPATESLRPPQDMLALAAVLQSSPREENQAAAGRLRTLATWKSLPTIYGADPDAIPITPPDRPGADPTPIQMGKPSPEVALPPRPPIRPAQRSAIDLLLALIAWALIMASFTVDTITNGDQLLEDKLRTGVAQATECVRYGPVSRSGFGYWYECRAEVTWRDGTRLAVSTRGSILTPEDVGRPVQVRETGGGRPGNELHRVDDPPRIWGVVVFLLLFLAGLLCILRPAADVFRLGRWLVKRAAPRPYRLRLR